MVDIESKFKVQYEKEAQECRARLDREKEEAKEAMKGFVDSTRRQEKLLSSAIFEMGAIINKVIMDRKKGGAAEFLNVVAEQQQKGYLEGLAESFISDQIKTRAQSNTKKA